MTHKKVSEFRDCPHCGKQNPLTAYVCLYCYKVLRHKPKVPWYKMAIHPSYPVGATVVVAALLGIYFVKCWFENIEAQVNMNFKSADYSLSVQAGKTKKQANADTEASAKSSDPSVE